MFYVSQQWILFIYFRKVNNVLAIPLQYFRIKNLVKKKKKTKLKLLTLINYLPYDNFLSRVKSMNVYARLGD